MQDSIYKGGASSSSIIHRRPHNFVYNDKTIVTSVYNRIAMDVAQLDFKHVKIDGEGRYLEDVESKLQERFSFWANLDQGPRDFFHDATSVLFDKGMCALVPVETMGNPKGYDRFDVLQLRVGEIVEFKPRHVKVSVYNDKVDKGRREEMWVEKSYTPVIYNPLYDIVNAPNSTLQRLIRKLQILDVVDEAAGSGSLDVIIQVPYTVKSESSRVRAEQRRKDLEAQLKDSQLGVAYADGSEKITQLNRPAENNLLKQVEYLQSILYDQLGLTKDILNGTASEETMLNYMSRTIEPILDAMVEAMQRAFLGPLGMRNNERIMYFSNPFRLVPVGQVAEIADKLTRNEILSSNEVRQALGYKPSSDPKADMLTNSNMPASKTATANENPEEQ